MHDRRASIEARLERAVRERLRPALHPHRRPLEVSVWEAPGEPVPVAEALAAPYAPTRAGEAWGRPWSTTWFRLRGQVPREWAGGCVEVRADLGFDRSSVGFQAEGLAHTPDGRAVKGLNPHSDWIPVTGRARGGEDVDLYVEAAANLSVIGTPGEGFRFLPSPEGDLATASRAPLYRTAALDLVLVDAEVRELLQDLDVLTGLMGELEERDARRAQILHAVEGCLDRLDPDRIAPSAPGARRALAGVLAAPAHASAHRLSAVGHAHIDSAWLWPVRESVRKVARTCANVVQLLDTDPEFVFAMSQAQQYAWIKEHRPEIWERVKEKVAEGRFVPVGGMWVESDSNLTGAEAMVRQFTHGRRFFLDEFGIEPREVWLPDSFGYSAALPQIMRLAGAEWFLTQKISWNTVNRFPHHTFHWEGIDGTRMLTHFPPADMYNSEVSAAEVHHAARNYAERGRGRHSLLPYGHGDGGGGPTREMLGRVRRLRDLEGSPRVAFDSPDGFHAKVLAECPDDPPVWSGELYLESHRGTYTSQARTKRGNRRCEHLLREAELWASAATVHRAAPYPYERLDRIWKTVLLHQFHDILPGSSIAWVHREAEAAYERTGRELEDIIATALARLTEGAHPATRLVANAAPHARSGVPALGIGAPVREGEDVRAGTEEGRTVLDNGLLRVTVDSRGLVVSVLDLRDGRETLAPNAAANLLRLHRDTPNQWDAWDLDEFYRRHVHELTEVDSLDVHREGAERAEVRVRRRFGRSTVVQSVALERGAARVDFTAELDWHEREKLLKAVFPLDVRAERSTAETQFGHVHRPTHTNTSWDAAKFEVCAHRWVHVAEPGRGVALVNEATYGHDVTTAPRTGGRGTTTTVGLSLLRAPLSPDPEADQGAHLLRYALVPGAEIADAVREGYRLNLPGRPLTGAPLAPLVGVDHPGVVVEAVKLADDRTGDVVVRLYESRGTRTPATVTAGFPAVRYAETDLMERPLAAGRAGKGGSAALEWGPFEILTLRLYRDHRPAPPARPADPNEVD